MFTLIFNSPSSSYIQYILKRLLKKTKSFKHPCFKFKIQHILYLLRHEVGIEMNTTQGDAPVQLSRCKRAGKRIGRTLGVKLYFSALDF